jgi:branched-chain amino acid transport system substrate-binding protein
LHERFYELGSRLSNAIRPQPGSFVFSAIFSTQDMLIAREHFAPSDVSVAAQIARVKAATPQVLIGWTAGTPAATLFRGEFEAGLDIPTFTSPANLNYSQLKRETPFLPKLLYFAGSATSAPEVANTPAWRSALTTFAQAVSSSEVRTDNILAGAWDPLSLLVDALRKLGPNATAAQLRQYVANTKGWTGVFGRYDFRATPQRGIDASSVVIVSWDSTKGLWTAVSRPGGAPLNQIRGLRVRLEAAECS